MTYSFLSFETCLVEIVPFFVLISFQLFIIGLILQMLEERGIHYVIFKYLSNWKKKTENNQANAQCYEVPLVDNTFISDILAYYI